MRRRLLLWGVVLAIPFAAVLLHDALVPVERQFATRIAIAGIEQYRAHVSPRLKGRVFCRFKPTCSEYGLLAVRKYGAYRGGVKTAWRVARCFPTTPMGTVEYP
ncbi:MAG: membrane protein insertion efficiency factor YidD [Thermoanaerobaculia bacterium]